MLARLRRPLAILGGLLTLYYGALFLLQRRLLFPAPPAPARPPIGVEVMSLTLEGGAVECLFLDATSRRERAPLVIYTHGNGELTDFWVDHFAAAQSAGFAVLLLEYPGYGRSAGAPSEASIRQAVLAAYDWARLDPRVDAARIVGYGRSLGGGAVAQLAAVRPLSALILESSFTGVRALAVRLLAPGFLVRDPFDTVSALSSYRGPLLVLHGERDAVVPFAHGQKLAAAVPGAEFQPLPCGHNDCTNTWPRIEAFLRRSGVAPRR